MNRAEELLASLNVYGGMLGHQGGPRLPTSPRKVLGKLAKSMRASVFLRTWCNQRAQARGGKALT